MIDILRQQRRFSAFHLITIPAAFAMSVTANLPLFFFATIHGFFRLMGPNSY